jgi:predicted component of type VI protein secretion system
MIPSTFLDRLLKRDPAQGLVQDIERTLNARSTPLPDFGGIDPEDPDDQRRLRQAIRRVLLAFDPRCGRVRITTLASRGGTLSLRIELEIAVPRLKDRLVVEAVHTADRWDCKRTRGAT